MMKLVKEHARRLVVCVVSALLIAVGLNFFFIPSNIFAAGFNGVAQLLYSLLVKLFGIKIDTGYFMLLLNVPVGILGWFKVGRNFTLYSVLNVVLSSVLTVMLPSQNLTTNPLMAALFGGIITGGAIGIALKFGFSTGGMDIISVIVNKTTGKSVGSVMLAINLLIILCAGVMFGWEIAMYTIIANYAMTKMVDTIHTSHQKLTALIITKDGSQLASKINERLVRGVTILDSRGAYRNQPSQTLLVVLTRYELYTLKKLVAQTDASAFIDVINTADLSGNFVSVEQQQQIQKQNEMAQKEKA